MLNQLIASQNCLDPRVIQIGAYGFLAGLAMHLTLEYAFRKGYATGRALEVMSLKIG
jgi:hypothetical protein